jgi:dihydroxy-acid dehydratase
MMEDLHLVGGTPAVLKYLLKRNLIDGECRTCTTHTLSTNLKQCPELSEGQDVILSADSPLKQTGHIQVTFLADIGLLARSCASHRVHSSQAVVNGGG